VGATERGLNDVAADRLVSHEEVTAKARTIIENARALRTRRGDRELEEAAKSRHIPTTLKENKKRTFLQPLL
jgi:hypothetical protein